MHGQFVWYELTTPDVDAAIKFYPRFTGWGTQRFDKDYVMWTTGGVPIGGIFKQTPEQKAQGVPPNWLPYVECNDVDVTASRAKSLGATVIVGPDDIPGTGRFAVLQDPQGAAFAIYRSSNQSGGWDGTPVVGRFSWHELMTTDHVKAAQFYNALFSWEKVSEMDMGGGQMYYMYGQRGQMYGGMFSATPEMAGMHPYWLVYINVRDVGKAVDTATKAGATVIRPQMDIPGGSIAILADPQGAGYAVHHVSAPAAAPKPAATAKVATTAAAPKKKAAAKKKAAPKKKAAAKKKAKAKAPARKARKGAKKSKPKAKAQKGKASPRKKAAKARPRRKAKAKK